MLFRLFNSSGRKRAELSALVHTLQSQYQYTPDIMELDDTKSCLLFLCNEMQTGHRFHQIISDGKHNHMVCPAFTNEPFVFIKRRQGAETYPIPLRMAKVWTGWDKHSIRGELWSVPSSTIRDIDNYYKQGLTTFDKEGQPIPPDWCRIKLFIKLPYRKERIGEDNGRYTQEAGAKPRLAWGYIGTGSWIDRVNDFDYGRIKSHVPHQYIPKIDRYFWFTTEEYDY
jgi:hypothetical protein